MSLFVTVGEKTVTATVESTEELNGTTETRNIRVVPDYQKIIENLMNIIKEENETINKKYQNFEKIKSQKIPNFKFPITMKTYSSR